MANADTGTTGNFISLKDASAILDVRVTTCPITVTLPDGSTAVSTHTGTLNLPSLPDAARRVDIFPNWVGSLLSIGVLCDNGLRAVYSDTTVTISDTNGITVLEGYRCTRSKLWLIDIGSPYIGAARPPQISCAVVTEARGTQEQIVAYYSACMGAPAPSTLIRAIDKLGLSLPGLTSEMVRRFPPVTTASAKGHMDQFQSGRRSTKPIEVSESEGAIKGETESDRYPAVEHRTSRILLCTTKTIPSSDIRFNDLTGKFGVVGQSGTQYFMIMICGNYIHIECLKSRGQADHVLAYSRGTEFFEARGITPSYERMDNEVSELLMKYCKNHVPPIKIQHVPAHNHRGNKAERAIRTFKNHFIASLCVTDPAFPLCLFDKLVEQAELTINLLRGSSFSPHVSAWHALNGAFDFSKTPIAPPGMKIVCFEAPDQRKSWAPHGVDGFYIGPAFDHHRCYKVYITDTKATRVTGQLSWHPPPGYTLPGASPLDDVIGCIAAPHKTKAVSLILERKTTH